MVGNDNAELFRARAVQFGVQNRRRRLLRQPEPRRFLRATRGRSHGVRLARVTSVCTGVSDYLHDAVDGFVLRDPRNTQTLSQLIERLHAEPDLRLRVGEAAAKTILEWDWNRNVAALGELLKNAKKRSHSRGF
jgi:glycosyltransferase involved in cell wall biosynthesis